jgi:DHA2 family methylenomycin A resistance protein-like MFS transporter
VATLATFTLAITEAGQRSWGAFAFACAGAIALGVSTARLDRRAHAPLVHEALRGQRLVWGAFGWGAVVSYALTTVLFTVPLARHGTALATGASLLPMTLLVALNPLVTARVVSRFGALLPIRLGLAAFACGLLVIAVVLPGKQHAVLLGAGLFACGLGVSWSLPPLVGYAVSRAPVDAAGAVGGVLNATRQVGATLGAAAASASLTAHAAGSWVAAPLLAAAALCGLAFVTTLVP